MKIDELVNDLMEIKVRYGNLEVGTPKNQEGNFGSTVWIERRKRRIGDDKNLGEKFVGIV